MPTRTTPEVLTDPHPLLSSQIAARPLNRWERLATQDTLLAAMTDGAAGLAANQLGLLDRAFAFRHGNAVRVVFNPLLLLGRATRVGFEACLSLPGYSFEVRRSKSCVLVGEDAHGNTFRSRLVGHEARVVQHEVDHLNGLLITGY